MAMTDAVEPHEIVNLASTGKFREPDDLPGPPGLRPGDLLLMT
jgi:hypothetical protein